MARNNGRWGRLRRVLNEDLSSSTAVYAGDIDRTPGDTPRYGAGANIENHPQVTDYIPRRLRVSGLILAAGISVGVCAETIAYYAVALAALTGLDAAAITDALSNRLVNWTCAVVLLVAAAYARIVFLLKRHRLDDSRGRYRVWRQAGLLSIVLSANYVTGAHQVAASALGHLTGMTPWGSSSLWWMMPTALVGGWVAVRLIRDAAECRMALFAFCGSAICWTTAVACEAGWSVAGWSDALSRMLPLSGCLLALSGTLLTARYVVLDVQGLIEHRVPETIPSNAARESDTSEAHAADQSRETPATLWTDGSEPDADYSDDDRPLSKAERKRLRKHHGRYRAA